MTRCTCRAACVRELEQLAEHITTVADQYPAAGMFRPHIVEAYRTAAYMAKHRAAQIRDEGATERTRDFRESRLVRRGEQP